ncbi:hypothetical protein B0H11DRAFT_2005928 [Mycena galericulata]|nr:hypothetical protein B0H11DRAFT_2005928 [Mycena galericulata]
MASLFSFGDILALASLSWTIAKVLRESTGSSGEYQALIAELDSLGTALQSLDQFVANPGPTKLQPSVENGVKFALTKCQTLMSEFLKKAEGYKKSLKKGGSGNSIRDSWRKIGWGLFKKDEIQQLKQQSLNLNSTALVRVEQASQNQQITSRRRGNNHKVIWFIDAVGNKLPIPFELCITRATFQGLLRVYFKNRAGSSYIEQEHYELAEEADGEVCGIKDWDDHVRPGITITTRMIYVQWESHPGEVCPSCQRAVTAQDASGFICSFCGTSVRDYTGLQDQFPARTSIALENDPGPDADASPAPAPEAQFIRRFLVRKAGARSAYAPGQRVSYWDSFGNAVHAVVKRFGLMVQEGTTVYNVRRESDGAHMCLPSTALIAAT